MSFKNGLPQPARTPLNPTYAGLGGSSNSDPEIRPHTGELGAPPKFRDSFGAIFRDDFLEFRTCVVCYKRKS